MLAVDRTTRRLHDGDRVFDPATRAWSPAPPPAQPEALTPEAALLWLQRESGHPLRTPIGVIGPNEASDAVLAAAEAVGGVLARCGLTLLCGGRRGVMTAACRGASMAGGLSIGLLPSADPATANPFASVVLPSGVGEARNAIIAQASTCLVAVGNSYGTLSEVALGLRLSKPVFGLCGAAQVEGVVHLPGPEALAAALARELLGAG